MPISEMDSPRAFDQPVEEPTSPKDGPWIRKKQEYQYVHNR